MKTVEITKIVKQAIEKRNIKMFAHYNDKCKSYRRIKYAYFGYVSEKTQISLVRSIKRRLSTAVISVESYKGSMYGYGYSAIIVKTKTN